MSLLRNIFARSVPLAKGGGHADVLLQSEPAVRQNVANLDVHGLPKGMIEVPDVVQKDGFSCGAAASFSVASYFGVGPKTLVAWKKLLGTSEKESTHPQVIIEQLEKLGLHVEAKEGMKLGDLSEYWKRGMPVIVMVQDYMGDAKEKAKQPYGHFLTVIGRDHGFVFCQDSSADNVTRGSTTAAAPGRVMIRDGHFARIWVDRDVEGRLYKQFGIAVGPPLDLIHAAEEFQNRR